MVTSQMSRLSPIKEVALALLGGNWANFAKIYARGMQNLKCIQAKIL